MLTFDPRKVNSFLPTLGTHNFNALSHKIQHLQRVLLDPAGGRDRGSTHFSLKIPEWLV